MGTARALARWTPSLYPNPMTPWYALESWNANVVRRMEFGPLDYERKLGDQRGEEHPKPTRAGPT